ncbi:unnamed protein product [Ixodes hexagonus]
MAPLKPRVLKLFILCATIGSIFFFYRATNSLSMQLSPVIKQASSTTQTNLKQDQMRKQVVEDSHSTLTTPGMLYNQRLQDKIRLTPMPLKQVLVHFDLKGAPPRSDFYDTVFPLLRKLGATGVLMEYEDTFPYWGPLKSLSAKNAYNHSELAHILSVARANKLKVIPLVQTFGHLEFALKLQEFMELRELSHSPQALCPSLNSSLSLVKAMLNQVLSLHPEAEFVHIGCDEVYSLGQCPRCEQRLQLPDMSRDMLFLHHVGSVIKHVVRAGVRPIMWDDMLRSMEPDSVRQWNASKLVDLMVWSYRPNISKDFDDKVWNKYSRFGGVWAASAFKGATGARQLLPDIRYHLKNHHSWLEALKQHKQSWPLRGIALTGWQRYDHFAMLCELFPASIPSLAANLLYLQHGHLDAPELSSLKEMLGCNRLIPVFGPADNRFLFCRFPGAKVLTGVQQLIGLLRQKQIMEKDSNYVGWLDGYSIQHSFGSPDHIRDATRNLSELLGTANHLQKYLSDALSQVYDSYTVAEWMGSFLEPVLRQLSLLDEQTQQLMSVNSWPRRPLDTTN